MERLRIGVIGLGWFGEIHCETIVGVPNLELAALCTRTPERLVGDGREVRRRQDLPRLPRAARRSRDRRGLDRDDVGSAHRAGDRGARGRQARLPREADGLDRRGLPARSSQPPASAKGILLVGHICRFNPRYRMAKQAIEKGTIGQDRLAQLAPQHPRRLDARDPQQDRPDHRRRDPRHRPDAVVHRRSRSSAPTRRRSTSAA